jgi:hypothetical protein
MTRNVAANSVMGLMDAAGRLQTSIVDCSPAGANVRIGKP